MMLLGPRGTVGQNPGNSDARSTLDFRRSPPGIRSPVLAIRLHSTESGAWLTHLVGFLLAHYCDLCGTDDCGEFLAEGLVRKFKCSGQPSSPDPEVRPVYPYLRCRLFRDVLHSAQEFPAFSHRPALAPRRRGE